MKLLSKENMTSFSLTALMVVAIFATIGAGAKTQPIEPNSRAYLHSYNLPASGVALDGYCPVAYFLANEPIKGDPAFASDYNGVTYYFVNEDARKLFDENPEKYLPAYGGWCAFGMAIQDKFPVDPTNFKIVDGKLMLFLRNENLDALKLWNQNNEQNQVKKADAYWNKVSN